VVPVQIVIDGLPRRRELSSGLQCEKGRFHVMVLLNPGYWEGMSTARADDQYSSAVSEMPHRNKRDQMA
jgi:hypothetical protein